MTAPTVTDDTDDDDTDDDTDDDDDDDARTRGIPPFALQRAAKNAAAERRYYC